MTSRLAIYRFAIWQFPTLPEDAVEDRSEMKKNTPSSLFCFHVPMYDLTSKRINFNNLTMQFHTSHIVERLNHNSKKKRTYEMETEKLLYFAPSSNGKLYENYERI